MSIDTTTGRAVPEFTTERKSTSRAFSFGGGYPNCTCGHGAPTADEPVGSLYFNLDGGSATTLYVKESPGASGWAGK
jgi:hypothetical protein